MVRLALLYRHETFSLPVLFDEFHGWFVGIDFMPTITSSRQICGLAIAGPSFKDHGPTDRLFNEFSRTLWPETIA